MINLSQLSTKVKEFFSRARVYIYIILIILFILLIYNNINIYKKNAIYKENIETLLDSVHTLYTSNGELLSYKQSYILAKKDLESYIDISTKERREIERKLNSSLAYIAKLESSLQIDTIYTRDSVVIDNTKTIIYFDYKDKWVTLQGNTKIEDNDYSTMLSSLQMNVPLKLGLTEDRKIFVSSDNPYLNIASIDGAAIENSLLYPKKKKWNIGIQLGVGACYDILHTNIAIGPYVGVGISYGFNF